MKITVIVAVLPPKLDGIGDYTAALCGELAKSAEVTILTATGAPCSDIAGATIKPTFRADEPGSVRQIAQAVKADKSDWVLLQYNPFSYGKWGLNLYLPRMMRQLKHTCPQTRFALMVHEPFVPVSTWKFAVMTTWQRWQLWSLGQSADVVFFSIDPWVQKFRTWFPGKPIVHLPVGSNITRVAIGRAQARKRLGYEETACVIGLFGTAQKALRLDWIRMAAQQARTAGHDAQLLYMGPDVERVRAEMGGGGLSLRAEGPLPSEEVSRRFAALDVQLMPFEDGISTRRTSLMTGLQHGTALIGTRGELTDTLLLQEDGKAFLLADAAHPEAFCSHVLRLLQDAPLRTQIGQQGQCLYQQHFQWPVIAHRLVQTLTERNLALQSSL